MFVNKYKILFFYSFGVLALVLAAVLYFNPKHLTYDSILKNQVFESQFFILNPETNNQWDQPTYQYRNGSPRQGAYHINFNPLKLKLTPLDTADVNHGAHRASKSTTMAVGPYIFSAGDNGVIQILKDKQKYWSLNFFNKSFGFHSTPILFEDHAIIGDYSGRLYFLNLKLKKIIWMIKIGGSFGATPLLENQFLYVNVETPAPDGFIAKIDLANTKILWISNNLGNHSHSSPAADKDTLFMGDNNGQIHAISKATGKTIWKNGVDGPIKSTPALLEDYLYFTSWDGYLYCASKHDGNINWKFKLNTFNQSSIALDAQKKVGFIISDLGLHKINLNDGAQLAFNKMNPGREVKKSSPVILNHNNKKYVSSACFNLQVCIYDFESLKILKDYKLNRSLSNQVSVHNDFLMTPILKESPITLLQP